MRELWVWNSNQPIESYLGLGAKTVKIEYSADGTNWTQLANVPEFVRAPGQDGYGHNTTVSFGGVSAKFVKLTIEKNWGGMNPVTGLSEVRFFYVPAAYSINNIVATASSAQPNMGPEKTIDSSGLDQKDGHSTGGTDMWLSKGTQPNWIQYQFDKVYALHELWVWNSNQAAEPLIGFGAKTVKIEYSADGTKWTRLADVPEFARASGEPGYAHSTTVSLSGVTAQYVKLTIEKNWGPATAIGLSEVRFFYIPDRPATKP